MVLPTCLYCGKEIPEERVLRGLRSNTPARYDSHECYVRAKNHRTKMLRAGRARVSEADVRTCILEGVSAPEMSPATIRGVAGRFHKTLSQIACEAGMPSTYPLYSYMSGKQQRLAPVTRYRLHLLFTLYEKDLLHAREHHVRPVDTGRKARRL